MTHKDVDKIEKQLMDEMRAEYEKIYDEHGDYEAERYLDHKTKQIENYIDELRSDAVSE